MIENSHHFKNYRHITRHQNYTPTCSGTVNTVLMYWHMVLVLLHASRLSRALLNVFRNSTKLGLAVSMPSTGVKGERGVCTCLRR